MSTPSLAALALACALSVGNAVSLAGQDTATCVCHPTHVDGPPSELALRSAGSFSIIQNRPAGQFGDNIGLGYGGNAAYLFSLDRDGILALRADVGFIDYGSESKRFPLLDGRVQVKVSTNNYIVPISFGPQLTWPSGSVRPYVNAGFGEQFFFTQSSIDGTDDSGLSTTNQHDHTKSWIAGGGVYVPVYSRKVNLMLDAGVQYYAGGHAQYLRPGGITDLPNGQILVTPLESDTHMLVVRLGVRVAAQRR
jgi:hypothetical protein